MSAGCVNGAHSRLHRVYQNPDHNSNQIFVRVCARVYARSYSSSFSYSYSLYNVKEHPTGSQPVHNRFTFFWKIICHYDAAVLLMKALRGIETPPRHKRQDAAWLHLFLCHYFGQHLAKRQSPIENRKRERQLMDLWPCFNLLAISRFDVFETASKLVLKPHHKEKLWKSFISLAAAVTAMSKLKKQLLRFSKNANAITFAWTQSSIQAITPATQNNDAKMHQSFSEDSTLIQWNPKRFMTNRNWTEFQLKHVHWFWNQDDQQRKKSSLFFRTQKILFAA